MEQSELTLSDFTFSDLQNPEALAGFDARFLHYLADVDQLTHEKLVAYRHGQTFCAKDESLLLIDCAPVLEAFIAEFFNIESDVGALQAATLAHDPIFAFKNYYVLREARRGLRKPELQVEFSQINAWLEVQLSDDQTHDRELSVAKLGQKYIKDTECYADEIKQLVKWCISALQTEQGQAAVAGWSSFNLPKKLDYTNLVDVQSVPDDELGRLEGPPEQHRHRDGFALTDTRMSQREVLSEVDYCVYCHKNDGDFCSKGFPVKRGAPEQGLKMSPTGEVLTGCPLEEKISEMQTLKKAGFGIGALAVIMIDNPMCPITGHRICNDCMKACIYQKQEPVNIPEVETRILTDVLDLPWGVEIYDLLTRWNPLRREQWLAKPYNGRKVLVMGMGPAGMTLAHHLLQDGFAVVGADGLKIEPLAKHFIEQPIKQFSDLIEALDDRVMAGFGGVAEYGITVRWDKNFLKLIYITLQRRKHFQVFGSIRFGGTLTVEDAWKLGFDHLALSVGAGLPRELAILNSLAPGMRQANDFLMALQLTGAAKKSSLANLQVRLPAVVIGGGLTGVDTATEVQAYYITQVEKIYERYCKLVGDDAGEMSVSALHSPLASLNKNNKNQYDNDLTESHCAEKLAAIRAEYSPHELEILDEFLTHAKAVRQERARAKQAGESPNFNKLIRAWGGVTIAYRRSMQESPAYKRNHEELAKAFEEGIYYVQGLEPKSVLLDNHGHVKKLDCKVRVQDEIGDWQATDDVQSLPARSIFVATGAKPNIAYEFEHRGTFARQGYEYERFEYRDGELQQAPSTPHVKAPHFGAFTSYEKDHHRVTFLGDTHSVFHGSVVKAVASAKRVYPKITESLQEYLKVGSEKEYQDFHEQMEGLFRCKIESIEPLNEQVMELRIRAPMAAQNFQPGQFYRIQNYECLAPLIDGTRLQTEALALIGIRCDRNPDVLSFIVQQTGVSSKIVANFKAGQHISLMGPTGAKSAVPQQPETVMIIGGAMAAAEVLAMGPAWRAAGSRILFVATFEHSRDIFLQSRLEAATDAIVWVGGCADTLSLKRASDRGINEELVLALRDYAQQENTLITLAELDRVYVIGSSQLLRVVQASRSAVLSDVFADKTKFLASVYGPMQCMLKGVCAQCLQWQVDPATGKRTKAVYACSWQHQPMEIVDIGNIDERLAQNSVQEKLSAQWYDFIGQSTKQMVN